MHASYCNCMKMKVPKLFGYMSSNTFATVITHSHFTWFPRYVYPWWTTRLGSLSFVREKSLENCIPYRAGTLYSKFWYCVLLVKGYIKYLFNLKWSWIHNFTRFFESASLTLRFRIKWINSIMMQVIFYLMK